MIKQTLITLILCLHWTLSIAADSRGVVEGDIKFTTLRGETHMLNDLLNSGKYVYVLTYKFPNICDMRLNPKVIRIGNYKKAYSCDKCNNYDMYTVVLNLNETSSAWHEGHNEKTNFVPLQSETTQFTEMFNADYAFREYLIKPDFTWEWLTETADSTIPAIGSTFFTDLDIHAHDCKVHIKEDISYVERENSSITEVRTKSISLNITTDDNYTLNIYSANGQRLFSNPTALLKEGKQVITFANANLSQGFYIAELSWSSGLVREKFYIQ